MSLVILAHPNFHQSIANKVIIQQLTQHDPDIEIRNIHQLYPDYKIDIAAAQAALLRHDLIILQYPMYWFNMPAILKVWFDEVFSYQFAYGSEGDKLKYKQLLISMTVGQAEQNYIQPNGIHLVDQFLQSIRYSAEYTQMQYQQPHILYEVSLVSGFSPKMIEHRAQTHGQALIQVIQNIVR
ncbi:NAD(P)H-dependent oxidoreductase [Acinetobacter ihumii]|uniref:NAD(P)H-dependent oxidoreductase n=1 Tax=Acinetobacter ihumii TaxID=2483802 RepID=UPI00102F60A3|nr:NAD(P)H-dependent oxidoreductase [Acinetobacter ihumii]